MNKFYSINFKHSITLFIIFFVSVLYAQNETNYWYFGQNGGMNFSNGDFEVLYDSSMQTIAGCTTASDRDGNLLFYSNSNTVWNSNHQVMENGTGLAGEINGIQNSIVIAKPDDPTTYYLFYVRENTQTAPIYYMTGVYYSEIKFDANNPLGYVTTNKDVRVGEIKSQTRISAIHHPESNSVRLVCLTKPTPVFGAPEPAPDEYVFRVFNVSNAGVTQIAVREINEGLGTVGAMKISPDGSYLAFAESSSKRIYFYKYDNDAITFEFDYYLNTEPTIGLLIDPYGLEFSQDSKIIYYSGSGHVVQFPYAYQGTSEPVGYYIMPSPAARSIQLARNGKIYVAHGDANGTLPFLSEINLPNKIGAECDFTSNSVVLDPGRSYQGLPMFIASSLRNRIIPSDDDCVDTEFSFELDAYVPINSVLWDFGDGTTSTLLNPTHQFSVAGIHKVRATIMVNNYPVTLYKDVEAYPLPSLDPGHTMEQCDTDTDGVSFFNLENIGTYMNNPNPDYHYVFYHSLEDAENDQNPIQGHTSYQNQTNPEQIFVKITSPEECVAISSFYIETTFTEMPEAISDIYVCEDSDNILGNGEGRFNIELKIQDIRQQFGFSDDFSIKIYASEQDAQTKSNPLDRYYTTSTTTVWVRVEDGNQGCNGIGSFQLIVNAPLQIDIEENYTICDRDLQPLTVLDGGIQNEAWQWKNSAGNILSTSRNFALTQSGSYSLTVFRTENGIQCSATKSFVVVEAGTVSFNVVSTENNQIYVSVIGDSVYEFSIDGINFFGQGDSYTFEGIETGFHVVYVRDYYNCQTPISQEVFLLNFPKFFTPNGDGTNDNWRISVFSVRLYPEIKIYIFDRYGKLITLIDMNKNAFGWDGTFNGETLPATDYWFKAILKDASGNTIQKNGHFSLIR